MNAISDWLKGTIWGIILLGCIGSAISVFLIFLGKKLYKYFFVKYAKHSYKKGYIDGILFGVICNSPGRVAISFTRDLFIFILNALICVISTVVFLILFITYDYSFLKLIFIIISFIIIVFSVIKILHDILIINMKYEAMVKQYADEVVHGKPDSKKSDSDKKNI